MVHSTLARILASIAVVVFVVFGLAVFTQPVKTSRPSSEISVDDIDLLGRLSREAGVLIRNTGAQPRVALGEQGDCEVPCSTPQAQNTPHPWFPGDMVFAHFHVRPVYWATETPPPHPTPTAPPRTLTWQEHQGGNIPPVSVFVSWGGHAENLEIAADGTTSGSNNIALHEFGARGCDNFPGSSGVFRDAQNCVRQVDYDIDWRAAVGGNHWDWIYFWVRDPDFSAMKAVDAGECDTQQWPYEYVNAGPKYYICQTFSQVHQTAHGYSMFGVDVDYDVLYDAGAPPSPTAGSTTTPPAPVTATPCPNPQC